MNNALLWIVVACYSGTAIENFWKGHPAWGWMWGAYAVALVAWIVAVR